MSSSYRMMVYLTLKVGTHIEFYREVTLPFPPFPGLHLQFGRAASEIATVTWDTDMREFSLEVTPLDLLSGRLGRLTRPEIDRLVEKLCQEGWSITAGSAAWLKEHR